MNSGQVVRIGYNILNKTGLFELACRDWRLKPSETKTLINFRIHFRTADNDRTANATTGQAGYHNNTANILRGPTTTPSIPLDQAALIEATVNARVASALAAMAVQPTSQTTPTPARTLSYCWTHGTSTNIQHNSLTCLRPARGHQSAATSTNMMGGSQRVWTAADRGTLPPRTSN
jgi:hypothetical protein